MRHRRHSLQARSWSLPGTDLCDAAVVRLERQALALMPALPAQQDFQLQLAIYIGLHWSA